MKRISKGLQWLLCALLTVVLLAGLLTAVTAWIPQSAIRQSVQKSADELIQQELFENAIDGQDSTRLDRYADSILLNITYSIDSSNPFSSLLYAKYHDDANRNANEDLYCAVYQDAQPNQEYLRYWHGSMLFLRPLLTVFNLSQIKIFNAVVLGVLFIVLLILLLRRKEYACALLLAISACAVQVWIVPMCLEYTWMFLVMLVFSILALCCERRSERLQEMLFIASGVCAAFFDFLTTETLPLLIPLFLLLWLGFRRQRWHTFGKGMLFCGKMILLWGAAYGFTWLCKWGVSSAVLQLNALDYVLNSAETRIYGTAVSGGLAVQSTLGIVRNLRCLFPFCLGGDASLGLLILATLLLFCFAFLFRKPKNQLAFSWICLLLGLLPYLRFAVLSNHSYLHFFFTYRAQMSAVLFALAAVWSSIDPRLLNRHRKQASKPTKKRSRT